MKFIPVLLSALLLAACTTPGVRLSMVERQHVWAQNNSRLNAARNWSLRGRIALRADERGWQAGIRWTKTPDTQEIQLSGPFGGGVVLVKQDVDGAVLRDSRGDEYMDTDGERLLEQVTGWRLPVNGLVYWIRGQVVPSVPHRIELDERGHLKHLFQQRWQITYSKYGDYRGLLLPRRMIMKLPADQNGGIELEVRLALNNWNFVP